MINEPPTLYRDYSRDPNIKALRRRGFTNHGSGFEGRGANLGTTTGV